MPDPPIPAEESWRTGRARTGHTINTDTSTTDERGLLRDLFGALRGRWIPEQQVRAIVRRTIFEAKATGKPLAEHIGDVDAFAERFPRGSRPSRGQNAIGVGVGTVALGIVVQLVLFFSSRGDGWAMPWSIVLLYDGALVVFLITMIAVGTIVDRRVPGGVF